MKRSRFKGIFWAVWFVCLVSGILFTSGVFMYTFWFSCFMVGFYHPVFINWIYERFIQDKWDLVYSYGETYGPFDCEILGCKNEAWYIMVTEEEYRH